MSISKAKKKKTEELTQFVDNDLAILQAFEQQEAVFYVTFDEQQAILLL